MRETRENMNEFVWRDIRSVEELGEVRMRAMRDFLADCPVGRADGRYVAESAPARCYDKPQKKHLRGHRSLCNIPNSVASG